jgi:K+-sensing histidine kinase KdpD
MVLLDIMMPEMDGYEVLQQLKADETLRHIPVIMISALHELDSVVRCIEMGADDYLCKPFEPTLLKARIGACLEKKHARDLALRFTCELQENYKRLQELEKQRDDLTHMIVHDLRTPLTSVIAGMQTMEMVGDLNEDQQEMAGIAISGGETLLGMINDLLDVEKMESGSMQLEYSTLDASELIAGAAGQVTSLCEGKKLTLLREIAPGLPPFQGDENKLRRVLVNLLGNAIKFTPSGGTLTVAAKLGEDEGSLVFSVSDTGEGIPPEAFAPGASQLRSGHRPRWRDGPGNGHERSARLDFDGYEPADSRRLGSDAPPQSRCRYATHPRYCTHRARDVERPRQSSGSGMRRL